MTSERHLQYLWASGQALSRPLTTRTGEVVEVLDRGIWNHQDGPDFLHARIRYQGMEFVGSVEMHLSSSLWDRHGHSAQPAYDGVILHIVWTDDASPEDLESRGVPCVALGQILHQVLPEELHSAFGFNACETTAPEIKAHLNKNYLGHLLALRVEGKTQLLEKELETLEGDWNALWLLRLMYVLGLKPNAEPFMEVFRSVPFSVWRRLSPSLFSLQVLLLGRVGLLDKLGEGMEEEYGFLLTKFQLQERTIPVYKKVLPMAAPHLRLLQVSGLFFQQDLFSRVVPEYRYAQAMQLMQNRVAVSGRALPPPPLTQEVAQRILLNELIPLHLLYQKKMRGKFLEPTQFYQEISVEKNSVVKGWKSWGIQAKDGGESQALIHQYRNFCEKRLCHLCPVGGSLL